jgi:hypothetical protein
MALTPHDWLSSYTRLSLRVAHQAGVPIDHRGPAAWRDEVAAEAPPPPGRLADDADELLDHLPFAPDRARFLAAHGRALRTVARRLAGDDLPLREYARRCLGIDVDPVPDAELEAAHDRLDAALPRTPGSVADRLHAWQDAHRLRPGDAEQLRDLVLRADAEARARTQAIVPLPEDEIVDCQVVSGVAFHAAGAHHGGPRSTVYVNGDVPFNVADLLYVVTHECHPGHIAESLLKEVHLAGRHGGTGDAGSPGLHEMQARVLVSPQFVVSEGLGLHAQRLAFPGDEAGAWLADHVYPELGIAADGADLAAVHEARNDLFGAWGNAALMLADGRSHAEVRDHLARWALLSDADLDRLGPDLALFTAPYAEPYVFCYSQGWRLVGAFLERHPHDGPRRLLTEPLLPADL